MWLLKPKETLTITQNGIIGTEHIALQPTRLCIGLSILSVLIWLGAVNYQVNVAYAVCFWVWGFLLVSALLTRRQLLGLQVELVFTDEVFVGETADVMLRLKGGAANRHRLMWWRGEYAVVLDEQDANHLTAWQRADVAGSLQTTYEQIWPIMMMQRGYFSSNLFLKLATTAPFGLFQVRCRLRWQTQAVVFAAPLAHNHFDYATAPDDEQIAQRPSMQGDDIAYLKNHQQGASLQHVAWKVYAKRGELMDKVFEEPPLVTRSETISYRDYPQGTPTDKLAGLLTHRVLQADRAGAAYTLELPHTTLMPQNGLREKCLNALALM